MTFNVGMHMRFFWRIAVVSGVVSLSGASSCPQDVGIIGPGLEGRIEVTERPVLTRNPNFGSAQTGPVTIPPCGAGADVAFTEQNIIGQKRVGIDVQPDDGIDVTRVDINFWFEGETPNTLTLPLTSSNSFAFDLPDTEDLGICDFMFYSWTVAYDDADESTGAGLFVGQRSFVMPTVSFVGGTCAIQNAQCAGPAPE